MRERDASLDKEKANFPVLFRGWEGIHISKLWLLSKIRGFLGGI